MARGKRFKPNKKEGVQCDCEEFVIRLLQTACGRYREHVLGGVVSPYDGLCREIFTCLVRYRRGCASVRCVDEVKDVLNAETVVRLKLKGPETEPLSLEQLWREHWREGVAGDVIKKCCTSRAGECQQFYLEGEPACLLILLERREIIYPLRERKLHHSVAFPRTIDWMRTGNYECVGVVHHKGHTASEGHYIATCLTHGATGVYHQFDDNSPPTPCSWTHLEKEEQMKSGYILVYVRVSERPRPGSLTRMWPYDVSSKSERERLTREGLLDDVVHLDGAPAAVGLQRSAVHLVGAIVKKEHGRLQAV
jgi:hypothetical protein